MPAVDLSAAVWRKSSRSGNTGSNDACVEVASPDSAVAVRDSKAPTSGALVFDGPTWAHFSATLRATPR